MHFYTKRFMEITIALVAIVAFSGMHRTTERENARLVVKAKIAETFNAALWERYGPGDVQPYIDLFATDTEGQRKELDAVQYLVSAAKIAGCPYGLVTIPEAPDWFQKNIPVMEELAAKVEKALEAGPALIPPGNPAFAVSLYLDTSDFNEWGLWELTQGLQILARKEWAEGNHEKAVKYLTNTIRLADALAPRLTSRSLSARMRMHEEALRGFDLLTWTNPSPAQNRLILEGLERIQSQNWTSPPRVNNLLINKYTAPVIAHMRGGPDAWVTALLLKRGSYHENGHIRHEVLETYSEYGLLPNGHLTNADILKRGMKWTTVPAMKRRAQNIPDSFFDEDPLLSAEAAQALPRLAYLASRLYEPERPGAIEQDFERTHAYARALLATYRARCWRDENNRWPNSEEFAQLVPGGADLQWMEVDPAEVIPQVKRMYEAYTHRRRERLDEHGKIEHGPTRFDFVTKYMEELTERNAPSVVYVNVAEANWPMRAPQRIRKRLRPQQEEMVGWIKAILEANTALVEKVVPLAVDIPNHSHPYDRRLLFRDDGMILNPGPPTHRVAEELGRTDLLEVHLRVPERCYYMLRSAIPGQDKVPRTEDQPLTFGHDGDSSRSGNNGPFRIVRYTRRGRHSVTSEYDILQLTGWD